MSLPRKQSVDKMRKVKKAFGADGDIGDKVKYKASNLISDKDALKHVDTYEDFMKNNKKITR